jgi:sugar phosphate isomerase/epimerase
MQTYAPLTRRDFLKSTTGLLATTGFLATAAGACAEQKSSRWCVACRDVHLKSLGQPDSWSALKELGATGVEVGVTEDLQCAGLFHPQKKYHVASPEGISALKEDLAAHGLRITALCMNNRLDERLDRELAWARQLLVAAQGLDVRAIRIDVVPRAIKAEEFMPFAVKACQQLCALAADTPVNFAIENHGHWTNQPEVTEALLNDVGSTHLGLTLDTMNFYWFGHPLKDLYGIVERFAPRTFHTHCKNLRYPADKQNAARPVGWEYEQHAAPLYEGDIDYRRVAGILARAKYGGDLCLENECLGRFPREQHAEILKKEVALLRTLAAE